MAYRFPPLFLSGIACFCFRSFAPERSYWKVFLAAAASFFNTWKKNKPHNNLVYQKLKWTFEYPKIYFSFTKAPFSIDTNCNRFEGQRRGGWCFLISFFSNVVKCCRMICQGSLIAHLQKLNCELSTIINDCDLAWERKETLKQLVGQMWNEFSIHFTT